MSKYILFFIVAISCSACNQKSELIKPSGDWHYINNSTKELPSEQR
jgi:hypothetical protein